MAINRRQAQSGISTTLAILFFIILIGFVNYLTSKHHYRHDVTENKKFSLSDQTLKILNGLQEPVKITCFFEEANEKLREVKSLLKEYQYISDQVDFKFIDPVSRPDMVERFGITREGTIVFEQAGNREETNGTGKIDFTSTLLKLRGQRDQKIVYFTEGHNEINLDSTDETTGVNKFKEALENQNYEVKKLALPALEVIPDDAAAIVIAGPKVDFLPGEIDLLTRYLDKEGRILILIDPPTQQESRIPSLAALLEPLGVRLEENFIIDTVSFMFPSIGVPVIQNFGWHQITKDFRFRVILPGARSISALDTVPKNVTVEKLAETSQGSWGETDLKLENPEFDEGKEIKGPLIAAVAIEKKIIIPAEPADQSNLDKDSSESEQSETQKEAPTDPEKIDQKKEKLSRIVVVGDADIAANAVFEQLGNSDFLLNSLSWMCQEEELISIRPKTPKSNRFVIENASWNRIFLIVFSIPILILAFGGFSWWSRR